LSSEKHGQIKRIKLNVDGSRKSVTTVHSRSRKLSKLSSKMTTFKLPMEQEQLRNKFMATQKTEHDGTKPKKWSKREVQAFMTFVEVTQDCEDVAAVRRKGFTLEDEQRRSWDISIEGRKADIKITRSVDPEKWVYMDYKLQALPVPSIQVLPATPVEVWDIPSLTIDMDPGVALRRCKRSKKRRVHILRQTQGSKVSTCAV